MGTHSKQQRVVRMQILLRDLPWYVNEFINHKKRKLSEVTLLNYCHDYKIFFTWLVNEYLINHKTKDIALEYLESLTVQRVDDFLHYLNYSLDNKDITVNR